MTGTSETPIDVPFRLPAVEAGPGLLQSFATLLFVGALLPMTSLVVVGADGPARVVLFALACLTVMRRPYAIRPGRYSAMGLWALGLFLALVFGAVVVTAGSVGLRAAAVSNFGSIVLICGLALLLRPEDFTRIRSAITSALLIGGFLTAVYVFQLAWSRNTLFVGVLRYSTVGLGVNHHAVFMGLAVVSGLFSKGPGLFRARAGSVRGRVARSFVLAVTLSGFVLLVSRTPILALVVVLSVFFLRRRYRVLVGLMAIVVGGMFYTVMDYGDVYLEHGVAIDAMTSGRGRLWYYTSDGGRFKMVSELFEEDAVFSQRSRAAMNTPTSYEHNTTIYLLLHVGVLGAAAFLAFSILALGRALKSGPGDERWALMVLLYLLVVGLGEQPLQFQSYGSLMYLLISYLAIARLSSPPVDP